MPKQILVAATIALIAFATGARAEPVADCRQGRDPALRLAACSAVIAGASFSLDEKAAAYRHRGNARLDAGALAEAIADLGDAIRLKPADWSAYLIRAQALVRTRDTAGAIADYGEAIRLNPRLGVAYNGRGHAHMVAGATDAAIDDFSKAIALAPDSASALNNRGLAYRKAGKLDAAIDDYTAAINLNPIYAIAYNNRGYALEAKGDRDAARADFRRALLLDPSMTGAKDGLARLGDKAAITAETTRLLEEGKALVEKNCSWCHATGRDGASPNPKAPPFRALHDRHPEQALREPLTRGIAAPHDEMPKFRLPDGDVDKIIAYVNSLQR